MSIEFKKVSYKEYKTARELMKDCPPEPIIRAEYNRIKLPHRSTSDSAGYDFYAPFDITVKGLIKGTASNDNIEECLAKFPTGIRIVGDTKGWFLMCLPRSGLGFNYGTFLWNTVGVIDSDYQNADNSGHIFAKFSSLFTVTIPQGKAFMQGILVPYLKVDEDDTTAERKGGLGSTDK